MNIVYPGTPHTSTNVRLPITGGPNTLHGCSHINNPPYLVRGCRVPNSPHERIASTKARQPAHHPATAASVVCQESHRWLRTAHLVQVPALPTSSEFRHASARLSPWFAGWSWWRK